MPPASVTARVLVQSVKVTDVVLSFTSPATVLVGNATFNLASTSKKAASGEEAPSRPPASARTR